MEYESDVIDVLGNEIEKLECDCQTTKIRYKTSSNDCKMYCKQCVKCGSQVGEWIPHADIIDPDITQPFDEYLKDYYIDSKNELRLALLERQKARENGDFTKARDDAMETQHWQDCKIEIRKRCGGVCEGCGHRQMVDVHHMTYINLGKEFLFELVGLCRDCHDRYHEKEAK